MYKLLGIFFTEFINVMNKHAPWKTISVRGNYLPWINSEFISLFRLRDKDKKQC